MSTDSVPAYRRTTDKRTPSSLRRANLVKCQTVNLINFHSRSVWPLFSGSLTIWSQWLQATHLLAVLFTVGGSQQVSPVNVNARLSTEATVVAGDRSIGADQVGVDLAIRVRIELTGVRTGDRVVYVQTLSALILEIVRRWCGDHEMRVLRSSVLRTQSTFQCRMVVFTCSRDWVRS